MGMVGERGNGNWGWGKTFKTSISLKLCLINPDKGVSSKFGDGGAARVDVSFSLLLVLDTEAEEDG